MNRQLLIIMEETLKNIRGSSLHFISRECIGDGDLYFDEKTNIFYFAPNGNHPSIPFTAIDVLEIRICSDLTPTILMKGY